MTTLSPVDIANLALVRCGAQKINSLSDQTNTSAIVANTVFQLAYLEVSRATRWGCLLTPALLVEIPQTPLPNVPQTTIVTVNWAPLTTYAALTYVVYSGVTYQVNFPYTSTNNFYNDTLTGALTQQYIQTGTYAFQGNLGANYASGWAHQYALPTDFLLLAVLNDNYCFNGVGEGSQYEIMGSSLYTDDSQAVIKYVQNTVDTTRFDPLFVSALVTLLASKLVTTLRLDGGGQAQSFLAEYERLLSNARTKDGDQTKVRRFNPINSSTFIQSRYGGVNG